MALQSGDEAHALLTDLYQLTMAQSYLHEGMAATAVFTLSVRRLPERRNFLLACGLDDVLTFLENMRFSEDAIGYLSSVPRLSPAFLARLRGFRFSGDVHAVPEGTPVFADEPILEVVAPVMEAQVVETYVLNQVHLQTVLASKAARVVGAAGGSPVVDFGLRRIHGTDAGLKGARAFYIAGVAATSNVLAGRTYGIPLTGTMAHSYVQAHDTELDAFRAFVQVYPDATLLVDTYDTLTGVDNVIRLERELREQFQVRAIRLDSGDLGTLSRASRERLDAAGLQRVQIFASSGLDEYVIRDLIAARAPIDGYGVGTAMGVSKDEPSLDMVYKLTEYGGRGRVKTSPGKPVLPGRKQIFRMERDGITTEDVIARHDEEMPGRPLLRCVMQSGKRVSALRETVDDARLRASEEIARLPAPLRGLDPPRRPFAVHVSGALARDHKTIAEAAESR